MKYLYIFLLLIFTSSMSAEQPPLLKMYNSYSMQFITNEEFWELIESSSVMVRTRELLRPPPDFHSKIEDGELLVDFLNRIIPPIHRAIAPNELVVIVIKRDSIERVYTSVRLKIQPEACKGITLSPGNIVILGLRS